MWVVVRCNVFTPLLSPLMTFLLRDRERVCVCVVIVSVVDMPSRAVSLVVVMLHMCVRCYIECLIDIPCGTGIASLACHCVCVLVVFILLHTYYCMLLRMPLLLASSLMYCE